MPRALSCLRVAELQSPNIEGLVRVGLCLENSETRMPEILSRFSKAHARVTVEIVSGDAQDLALMLANGELDIAILTTGGGAPLEERDRLIAILDNLRSNSNEDFIDDKIKRLILLWV